MKALSQPPARQEFKAVVLDLFDTLVKWDPNRLPMVEVGGRQIRSTTPWLVERLSRSVDGEIDHDRFAATYGQVWQEIVAVRERELTEVTCYERFYRTLTRLELPLGEGLTELAEDLRRIHMAAVRRVTFAPEERVAVVRSIAPHYRLGLLSNFDDSQTGREVLSDTGVSHLFEAVIISADVGVRKPHPRIFGRLLEALALEPAQVLFVGDTPREDVLGARRAGIPVAWLSENKGPYPEDLPAPDFVLGNLTELPALLGI